jgi:major vault protein
VAEIEAEAFRQKVEAMGGGQNLVQVLAAQAQAAVVGGIDKLVFVPSGAGLNLFTSMQDLLGKVPLSTKTPASNGAVKEAQPVAKEGGNPTES